METEIATEADFKFVNFLHDGSVNAANADILLRIAIADIIFRNQMGINFSVVYQNAWTSADDPYDGADSVEILEQFRVYWNANVAPQHIYDVAHLFSGFYDPVVGGRGYMPGVCGSWRYGGTFRLLPIGDLVSDMTPVHELGHNFNAAHDSDVGVPCGATNYIMCDNSFPGLAEFSPESLVDMSNFVDSISCLSQSQSQECPFPPLAPAPPNKCSSN